MEPVAKTTEELRAEMEELRWQLQEATETIEAIRTGQIDALVVQSGDGHQLYTLRSADHAYRIFLEKMTEGAITLNRQGVVLFANSRFAAMVGQPLPAVLAMPLQQLVAAESQAFFQTLFDAAWQGDGKGEVLLQNGAQGLPVLLSLALIELESGPSLSVIVTDLSMQKAQQQQLEEKARQLQRLNQWLEASNHDLQQFASVASHDLQEPLRKISMFANLLQERFGGVVAEEGNRYLARITASASRMRTLIVDVLSYSRLSARQAGFEPVDLNTILAELIEDFELTIAEKAAVVHTGPLPVLEANRGQMRQVFQNLLSNALKFCRPGVPPQVTIGAKMISANSFTAAEQKDGAYCLISVKDNGIGFDEQYATNIFSLFERLHTKDEYEGTGIGLAISKKIIEKHQGLITARSTAGSGAEFLMILPLKQTDKA